MACWEKKPEQRPDFSALASYFGNALAELSDKRLAPSSSSKIVQYSNVPVKHATFASGQTETSFSYENIDGFPN